MWVGGVNSLVYTRVLTRVQLTSGREPSSNPPMDVGWATIQVGGVHWRRIRGVHWRRIRGVHWRRIRVESGLELSC